MKIPRGSSRHILSALGLTLSLVGIYSPKTTFAQTDPCKIDVPYILCDGKPGCEERARANIKRKEDECRARRNRQRTLTPEEIETRRQEAERLAEERFRARDAARLAAEERERIEQRQKLNNQIDAEMERMEKEQRNAELNRQIDAGMAGQTFQKGRKIYAPSAESGGIPADPDIDPRGVNWDRERANLITQRRAYPNQRFLNGPAPKDGQVIEGCKWETVTGKIAPWGCDEDCDQLMNGRNPVAGFIADAFGRPADLGGYIVLHNVGSHPAWFAIGSLGGGQFNNGSLPPKSKRKMYAGKYINRKTKIITNVLTVRYCVPTEE